MKRPDWATNRNMAQKPLAQKPGWCLCDRARIRPNERCHVCGRKEKAKNFKYQRKDQEGNI